MKLTEEDIKELNTLIKWENLKPYQKIKVALILDKWNRSEAR